jgi:uncharacterized membrane protein
MLDKVKDFFMHRDKELRSNRWIFITILITSVLALIAAFVLSVEAFELAKNPNAVFECSVNAVVNCATVAKSSYASLLGFPNSLLGMISEPTFILLAILLLIGVKLPKKFMFVIQVFTVGALFFAIGLFYISTALIGALCPWCMLVLASTIVMFFAITKYNIREDNLYFSKKIAKKAKNFIKKDYDKFLLALIFVIIVAIIVLKYGSGLFA